MATSTMRELGKLKKALPTGEGGKELANTRVRAKSVTKVISTGKYLCLGEEHSAFPSLRVDSRKVRVDETLWTTRSQETSARSRGDRRGRLRWIRGGRIGAPRARCAIGVE